MVPGSLNYWFVQLLSEWTVLQCTLYCIIFYFCCNCKLLSHVCLDVGQPKHLSLWVGTSSGHVFIYQLTVPDGEKRREEDVTCFLGKAHDACA